jgi:EAL and modified HD-GYP domain-containing signal transduction protein
MVLADTGEADGELLVRAMTRARMCEVLSVRLSDVRADAAFTAGLLSSLDFLLGVPIATVVERLPLHPDVADALVHRAGPLGQVLDIAVAYEDANLTFLADCPIDLYELATAYLAATSWSLQISGQALSA